MQTINHISNLDTIPPKSYLDSLNNEIIKLKFEKDSYTQLMDAQSNLIIGYVTLLFALFGIAGITLSNRLAKEIKEDYQKEKVEYEKQVRVYRREQNSKYESHNKHVLGSISDFKKEINDLKVDSYRDSCELYDVIAFLHRSNGIFGLYISKRGLFISTNC